MFVFNIQLYLRLALLGCKTEKWNSQCEHRQQMEQTRGSRCGSLSITPPVSLLANEFDV